MAECISFKKPVHIGSTRDAIQNVAELFAKSVNFTPDDPIEDLVTNLGGRISRLIDISKIKNDNSLIVISPKNFHIILSSFIMPEYDRVSIAHELGHYILHSAFGQTPILADRYGSDPCEWEANWFASALLIPKDLLEQKIQEHNANRWIIASLFKIKTHYLEQRCEQLGINLR